jgi:hypothetical protein
MSSGGEEAVSNKMVYGINFLSLQQRGASFQEYPASHRKGYDGETAILYIYHVTTFFVYSRFFPMSFLTLAEQFVKLISISTFR